MRDDVFLRLRFRIGDVAAKRARERHLLMMGHVSLEQVRVFGGKAAFCTAHAIDVFSRYSAVLAVHE